MSRTRVRRSAMVVFAAVGAFLALPVSAWGDEPLPTAEVTPDGARGAALSVPGLVTISESSTGPGLPDPAYEGGAHWTGISVLDTELIGADSPAHAVPAQPTGALAPVLPAVQSVDALLCPGALLEGAADQDLEVCAVVLSSSVEAWFNASHADGSVADISVGVVDGSDVLATGVEVLPSRADGNICGDSTAGAALAELTTPFGEESLLGVDATC